MNRNVSTALITEVILVFLFLTSCDYYIKPPFIGSTWISNLSNRGVTAKSRVIWDGGSGIIECGFCWNTTGYPTKADSAAEADLVNELLFCNIEKLSGGTKYYLRSYARNKAGIFYGDVISFTTSANKLPVVTTPWVFFVSHNTLLTEGGGIVADNTYSVFSKGVCWSTSINPTINDSKIELGSGFGSLSSTIEGLKPSTVYYIRGYATNVVGISYGGNKVFKTFDGFTTDHEGHVYSTVRLGKQEWMNRNLETKYFSNGDLIRTTGTPTVNTDLEEKPLYQWPFIYLEDHPELLDDYGRLYTWYTVTDSRKLCPDGWHIPSIDEWNELLVHTDDRFRSAYNYNWESQINIPGAESGFNPQQVGFRTVNGQFQYGTYYGSYWWSATEASDVNAFSIYCRPSAIEKVIQSENSKKSGFSVRCVKD